MHSPFITPLQNPPNIGWVCRHQNQYYTFQAPLQLKMDISQIFTNGLLVNMTCVYKPYMYINPIYTINPYVCIIWFVSFPRCILNSMSVPFFFLFLFSGGWTTVEVLYWRWEINKVGKSLVFQMIMELLFQPWAADVYVKINKKKISKFILFKPLFLVGEEECSVTPFPHLQKGGDPNRWSLSPFQVWNINGSS